ncbi:hypothetical protein D9613_005900 [Agrocybe pediades]|uniref:PQ-loop-domain-containing protein n=1 Tax=Agrocybe pediades TaxID=84607 RepID=A0A8H4VRQ7_9AGAR|nr:hypothetical protein D9613_005900 [Agrocybe pediades]
MLAADNISSILGWISIACWIIVYSPQIYENYTLQSGEGLSVSFVIIWLLGDLTNLLGASLGGLLPTVILLALYYTTCDTILLFQIYYYRWKRSGIQSTNTDEHNEQAPLFGNATLQENPVSAKTLAFRYMASLLFVTAVGIAAWWVTRDEDTSLASLTEEESQPQGSKWLYIQLLGWSSAALFLGARVPQICQI